TLGNPTNNLDDYNTYYPGLPHLLSTGTHESYADPQFLNFAAYDFRLAAGSPAAANGAYAFAGSIGDCVWNDLNNNGVQDAGEPGLNGVTIDLLDSTGQAALDITNQPITTTTANNPTTGAAGYYQFANLPPGSYLVQFVAPAGYVFSPQGTASTLTTSV